MHKMYRLFVNGSLGSNYKMKITKKVSYGFSLSFVVLLLSACLLDGNLRWNNVIASEPNDTALKLHRRSVYTMGSLLNISIYSESDDRAERAMEKAFNEVDRLDWLMSNYKNDSELSRINREATDRPVACNGELISIIEESIRFSNITRGGFDITVSPLVKLWGFYGNADGDITGNVPSEDELKKIIPSVSYKNIKIDVLDSDNWSDRTIFFKNRKTQIDLGAIGKGYAVDKAAEVLKKAGITSGLINFAGNIYAFGSPPGRKDWVIGLKDPTNSDNIKGAFRIKERAVATSGDYERFFIIDNKKYAHIIDPRTGMPVRSMLSVTIVSEDATTADALSTGVFVLGPIDGIELIESLDGVEGILIFEDRNGNVVENMSTGFKALLEKS